MSGPIFDARAPLADTLKWPALPQVLRRTLTRSLSPHERSTTTLRDSLRGEDPRLNAWLVALLALDVGVDIDEHQDNLIGVFARGELQSARVTHVCIHSVGDADGFGVATRHGEWAAAYLQRSASRAVECAFIFVASKGQAPRQIDVPRLHGAATMRDVTRALADDPSLAVHAAVREAFARELRRRSP